MDRLLHISTYNISPLSRPHLLLSASPFNPRISSPLHFRTSFLGFPSKPSTWSGRFHATNPGPPSPKSDPPFDKDPIPSSGLEATFSKLQDRVQIFFAVLFWMSLFFWACAWDGRNDGRPNKGSRFGR